MYQRPAARIRPSSPWLRKMVYPFFDMGVYSTKEAGDLDLTRRLIVEYLQGQSVRIWLFGSRAWGGAERSSDIDIGILPMEPLPPGTLAGLQEELDESVVLPRVEVFDLKRVDPVLRDKVISQGVPWRI